MLIPIKVTKYRLVQPTAIECIPYAENENVRCIVTYNNGENRTALGKSEHEAIEIFNAYFKAVKAKKRCFDYVEYEKEKTAKIT